MPKKHGCATNVVFHPDQIGAVFSKPSMRELLEANDRSQVEQGTPDSKKQVAMMQIGVDDFAISRSIANLDRMTL